MPPDSLRPTRRQLSSLADKRPVRCGRLHTPTMGCVPAAVVLDCLAQGSYFLSLVQKKKKKKKATIKKGSAATNTGALSY